MMSAPWPLQGARYGPNNEEAGLSPVQTVNAVNNLRFVAPPTLGRVPSPTTWFGSTNWLQLQGPEDPGPTVRFLTAWCVADMR